MILTIYLAEPKFPATDQSPSALRTTVNGFWVDYTGSAPSLADVQAVITPPTTRKLLDIITDLNALTANQKNAVWADVTNGNPPKWELDAGANASAIAVLQLVAGLGLSAADILAVKIRGVAMYVQDNPSYLVNPAFDATINIPGKA